MEDLLEDANRHGLVIETWNQVNLTLAAQLHTIMCSDSCLHQCKRGLVYIHKGMEGENVMERWKKSCFQYIGFFIYRLTWYGEVDTKHLGYFCCYFWHNNQTRSLLWPVERPSTTNSTSLLLQPSLAANSLLLSSAHLKIMRQNILIPLWLWHRGISLDLISLVDFNTGHKSHFRFRYTHLQFTLLCGCPDHSQVPLYQNHSY